MKTIKDFFVCLTKLIMMVVVSCLLSCVGQAGLCMNFGMIFSSSIFLETGILLGLVEILIVFILSGVVRIPKTLFTITEDNGTGGSNRIIDINKLGDAISCIMSLMLIITCIVMWIHGFVLNYGMVARPAGVLIFLVCWALSFLFCWAISRRLVAKYSSQIESVNTENEGESYEDEHHEEEPNGDA